MKPLLCLVAATTFLFLAGCADDNSNTKYTGAWPPQVGEQYRLGSAVSGMSCYDTADVLGDVEKAVNASDNEGYQQIEIDHGMMPDKGDLIRVLDYNAFNGHLHLRIRSGRLAGRDCWYLAGDQNGGLFAKHV